MLNCGLQIGAYHAFIASVDGNAQAQFFYDTVAPYLNYFSFPLAIDVELDNGQTPAVIMGRLFDLCSTLEALGQTVMIYTSSGFWGKYRTKQTDGYFAARKLWLAQWTSAEPVAPYPWTDIYMHQYKVGDAGTLPGVKTRIDRDRMRP